MLALEFLVSVHVLGFIVLVYSDLGLTLTLRAVGQHNHYFAVIIALNSLKST